MKVARLLVLAELILGLFVPAYAQTTSAEVIAGQGSVSNAAKSVPTIFISDGDSVAIYERGAFGNVLPIARISDDGNTLRMPWGIALDLKANIYTTNYEGGLNGAGSITVYPAGSKGDTVPIATISGARTELRNPFGVALDSSGKIYVANFMGGVGTGSVTIYSSGSNGNVAPIATIAGDSTGLDNPGGIAVDSSGKIYVANRGGGRNNDSSITVYAAGSTGNAKPIATIAGSETGLDDPCIAVDSSGRIYAGNSSDSIMVYPAGSNGNVKPIATIVGPDKGDKTGLSQPNGIALDSRDNIYATNAADSDFGSQQDSPTFTVNVYRSGSNGNVKPIATLKGPAQGALGAQGVAVDPSGKIYVTTQFRLDDDNNLGMGGAVVVLSPLGKGEIRTVATIFTTGRTGIHGDSKSIAVDSKGNIYLATPSGGSDNGSISVFAAGRYGNVPPIATISADGNGLHFPMGIAVDSDGKMYVPNIGNGRDSGSIAVYSINSKGNETQVATITGGNLVDLRCIALDSSRNIYVSNYGSALVYRGDSNGDVLPLAIIDRGAQGIAVDSNGKVYMTVGSSDDGAIIVYPPLSQARKGVIALFGEPIASIKGSHTGLINPRGIAVDSDGFIYVANEGHFDQDDGSVTVYRPNSDGDIEPIGSINGPLTGLRDPYGIALGPTIAVP